MAFGYGVRTAWFSAFLAVLGNGLFALGMGLIFHHAMPVTDVFVFSAAVAGFTWFVAPPSGGPPLLRIRTAYRLLAVSAVNALVMLLAIYVTRTDPGGVYEVMRSQVEQFSSLYTASSGADAVSLTERYFTPDALMEMINAVSLRGGALVSCILLFFLSRQIAASISRFALHGTPAGSFTGFHAGPNVIWLLSLALLSVILGQKLGIAPLEIGAWNALVICAVLYLAQGCGILMFFVNRRALSTGARFFLTLLVVIAIFSPGINVILVGIVILLGVAENWAPFRVSNINGPSSTPGV
ncbi:hypothetical protein AGMMS50267_01690 [Spirochaetia bacterium]|nr:hypothetical protein AGMMS50267_01690 [Spirochaetia bacterium]